MAWMAVKNAIGAPSDLWFTTHLFWPYFKIFHPVNTGYSMKPLFGWLPFGHQGFDKHRQRVSHDVPMNLTWQTPHVSIGGRILEKMTHGPTAHFHIISQSSALLLKSFFCGATLRTLLDDTPPV